MAGARRTARILALQALYEGDTVAHDALAVLERLLTERLPRHGGADYARHLVKGVLESRDYLDDVIARAAPVRPPEQLAPVDRNILRLAIYEILVDNKVPTSVAINEAVELAKAFGSDSSPRFINGVLGTVALMAVS